MSPAASAQATPSIVFATMSSSVRAPAECREGSIELVSRSRHAFVMSCRRVTSSRRASARFRRRLIWSQMRGTVGPHRRSPRTSWALDGAFLRWPCPGEPGAALRGWNVRLRRKLWWRQARRSQAHMTATTPIRVVEAYLRRRRQWVQDIAGSKRPGLQGTRYR